MGNFSGYEMMSYVLSFHLKHILIPGFSHFYMIYKLILISVSAIVEVSVPQATYFDIPQMGVKTDFFKQNH